MTLSSDPRPRVVVVFTGGTISMLRDPETGLAVPTLSGAEILQRMPGLDAVADIEAADWGLVTASHLRFRQILDIARLLRGLLGRPDIDGVVVVQGTDTIDETAEAMAAGVPVVHTTRCPSGRVSSTYGFPGGGGTWAAAGAIPAGFLGGPKGRVALALGLGSGLDEAGLYTLFAD